MTIEQVIELGNIDYDTSIFAMRYWIWWTIITILVIIEIVLLYISFQEEELVEGTGLFFFAPLGLLGLLLLVNLASDINKENELIEQWKKEIALPYISTLPIEKSEVVYIKIDPELSHKVSGGLFYTYSTEIQRTPLTVSFKGNGVETITNWYETHMELTDSQTPQIEYKRLTNDLGNDMNAGLYDVKVYLPNSYMFTDIK